MRVRMLENWDAEIGDIGIEYEFLSINRKGEEFRNSIHNKLEGYEIVHDASSEDYAYVIGKLKTTGNTNKDKAVVSYLAGANQTVGGELVSPIYKDDDVLEKDVHKLVEILREFGEKDDSLRDSLHVHVNLGNSIPLSILKRLLKMTIAYEAILYRLGGLGRRNRGESNQYTFQRPYLGNGPPVYMYNYQYYPICNYKDLLDSDTKREFFNRFGDTMYHIQAEQRYVTQRYMGVNFYTVPCYGSIEFRHANKCLNPEYILAWIYFCKAFVNKAFYRADDKTEDKLRPLYENKDIDDKDFRDVLNTLNLSDRTKLALLQIWKHSPTPQFDNVHRTSHLPKPTFFSRGNKYLPEVLHDIKPKNAIHTDIHKIRRKDYPQGNIDVLFPNRKKPKVHKEPRVRLNRDNFWENAMPDIEEVHDGEFIEEEVVFLNPRIFKDHVRLIKRLNLDKIEPETEYTMYCGANINLNMYRYRDGNISMMYTFTDEDGIDWEYHTILREDNIYNWHDYPIKEIITDVIENQEVYFT